MTYLTCPLCLEEDFDRVGLALYYENCIIAEALADEEHQRQREWREQHAKSLRGEQQ